MEGAFSKEIGWSVNYVVTLWNVAISPPKFQGLGEAAPRLIIVGPQQARL